MKIKMIALTGALALAAFASVGAAQLTDQDKQFLTKYDKVHHALVADDLAGAKAAAKDLGGDGSEIANASSLKDARAGFEKLSSRAKTLAAGGNGYHVMHCPMLKKDWVQTSDKVENPYGGKEMLTCGEMKK
jgi:hypothetical protein